MTGFHRHIQSFFIPTQLFRRSLLGGNFCVLAGNETALSQIKPIIQEMQALLIQLSCFRNVARLAERDRGIHFIIHLKRVPNMINPLMEQINMNGFFQQN
ncbi:hypothetical protein D3C85_1106420 [compost metagenome]